MLGRELARQAVARGHDVTCLARGSQPVTDGAHLVRADRDDDGALSSLAPGEQNDNDGWDAIIDVTRQPGHARRAVRDLRAQRWILVSSGNAYARFDRPEQSEDAPLQPELVDDVMTDMSRYGEAKVACENAYRTARTLDGGPATVTIIRAGLIGGRGDWSGRSGYYPWRFAHPTGDDVLAPPDPDFPIAMIDVEDLAAWTLDCAENGTHGTFNATGPTITLGEVLDTARRVAGSSATIRHVAQETLTDAGINDWMGPTSLPLWIADPEWRWFATMDTTAARRAGLRTRPLAQTLTAALDDEHRREQPRSAGLTDDEEIALRSRLA